MAAPTVIADARDFLVRRHDLRRTSLAPAALPAVDDDKVLLAIDAFGFTANNVTYAAIGERFRYWEFFPAASGWGRIPVWGFATVVASRHRGVRAGERFYGYLPMSTHLVVSADHVRDDGFTDVTPHRTALPRVYNRYLRAAADPGYDAAHEDAYMLLRPLFATAFLLDDLLAERGFFGAGAIVLASASSKTAIGLAALLAARRERGYQVVGLTAAGNAAFVGATGPFRYRTRSTPGGPARGSAVEQPRIANPATSPLSRTDDRASAPGAATKSFRRPPGRFQHAHPR